MKSIDVGFKKYIMMPVDKEGDKPSKEEIEHCKQSLGYTGLKQKWFDVKGRGYGKDWMWVIGY